MRQVVHIAIVVLALLCVMDVRAQTADTSSTGPRQTRPGFDLPDSLYIIRDSLGKGGGIDTIVQYTARDSIVFDVGRKRMILVGEAAMNFQSRTLNAHTIVVDFENSTLTAYSEDFDSIIENSLSRRRRVIRDTSRVASRGAPILREGDTPYEGEIIVYNFKTRSGTVQLGTTTMEGGFYYGERIKQVDRNTLFVENGRFTTCDAPIPHYYFESPKMKVVMRDKVFAAPVFMYVSDVPIFALPFGLFPNQGGGRRSGIIPPNYQTTGSRGFGLTHLGYYQVFSDYFDAAVQGDLYTKGGYNVSLLTQYMQRYLLSGPAQLNVGYGFTRLDENQPYQKQWLLNLRIPNLILGLFTNLSASLQFQSSDYYRSNAQNVNDLLRQNATSNASFTTQWEDIGVSLSADYNRSQNLITNEYQENSPTLRLSKNSFFPFALGENDDPNETNLLRTLQLSYDLTASRAVSRTLRQIPADVNGFGADTSYRREEEYGVLHSPRISVSPKFGYVTFTPSFNYSEAWFFRHQKLSARMLPDGRVDIDTEVVSGFDRAYRYDASLSLATTLYGILNIGAFGVQAIRHTLSPNVSISYRPDFSSQSIDYFTDPLTGRQQEYNIFQSDANAGIAIGSRSATIGFGLGNDFEAKVENQVTADSVAEEKVRLLNLSANSGYDVIQDRLSNLSIGASSRIGADFSVSGNALYSFYPRNFFGGDSTERTLISLRQGFLRPINAQFSVSGSISSPTSIEGDNIDSLRNLFRIETPEDERALMQGGIFPGRFVRVPFRPTWNISYSLSYTENYNKGFTVRDFSANAGLTLALTKNWNISTNASYDFVGKRIVVPSIRIHRDLHCWEMNLDYRPTGFVRGFNFEIRVKAEQLRDLKLTRTDNSYGQF